MTKEQLERMRLHVANLLAVATERRKEAGVIVSEDWQQGYDWASYLVNAIFEMEEKIVR